MQLRLESGISLAQISPDLNFRSDTSDVGWGAHLADEVASGLWSVEEAELSINARDLLSVERGLLQFHHLIFGSTVAIFADNSTAMAYLCKQGGTRSPVHNSIAQWILRWAESLQIVLAPQFILGKNNVLADSLSRTNQVQGSEWTLKWEVFQDLHKKWPVMIDLFATSLNHRFSLYIFALPRSEGSGDRCSSSELGRTSGVRLSTLVSDSAGSEETPLVLRSPHDGSGSVLDSAAMVSRPVRSGSGRSSLTSLVSRSRSSQTASLPLSSSRDPQAVSSCLATVQRFARAEGFSSRVASQIGFARRASSRTNYQVKWSVYRQWCRSEGLSISRPTLPKIADFLSWLCKTRKLSVSSILGYCSMLSSFFRFKLYEISSSPVLKDLILSFKVETPVRWGRPGI